MATRNTMKSAKVVVARSMSVEGGVSEKNTATGPPYVRFGRRPFEEKISSADRKRRVVVVGRHLFLALLDLQSLMAFFASRSSQALRAASRRVPRTAQPAKVASYSLLATRSSTVASAPRRTTTTSLEVRSIFPQKHFLSS
jgi:hypothetical protein